jgi:hypothetical protein
LPEHAEKRNKHTKKNCAPSWLYLQDHTGMHSQQNIKKEGEKKEISDHDTAKSTNTPTSV